jgi:hypothetical protein
VESPTSAIGASLCLLSLLEAEGSGYRSVNKEKPPGDRGAGGQEPITRGG